MLDEEPLHQECGKPEKRFPLIAVECGIGRKRPDPSQLQVQLVDQNGGLPGMVAPLALHPSHGQTPQFGIKKLYEFARRLRAAFTKLTHEAVGGIRIFCPDHNYSSYHRVENLV